MSLRKWCRPPRCSTSPNCEHHWFYDFRVNRRRYRESTETASKQRAKEIEAEKRLAVLDGRHQIRRLTDRTFAEFSAAYFRDHVELNHRVPAREREILKVLDRAFGPMLLREITPQTIERFKRQRSNGELSPRPRRLAPATVNRELDTLSSVFTKAVEWKYLHTHPMKDGRVRELKVANVRTRILTEAEQLKLLAACPLKLALIVRLALITGARIGELLALAWADVVAGELVFLETKNGTARRLPLSPALQAVLAQCPRPRGYEGPIFVNARTQRPYTVNGLAHTFRRAVARAGIRTGDVTLHTLRHTALSRMVASGFDQFTVMAISGHSSTRMLARYTHPTDQRKVDALDSFKLLDDGQKMGSARAVGEAGADESSL